MNKNKIVKSVDIVFENCEVIHFNIEEIELLQTMGVKESLLINRGKQSSLLYGDYLLMWFKKDLLENKTTNAFGFDDYKTSYLKRLQMCDLSHIDLIYEDGTNDYICVWQGTDDYTNIGQTVFIDGENVRLMIESKV